LTAGGGSSIGRPSTGGNGTAALSTGEASEEVAVDGWAAVEVLGSFSGNLIGGCRSRVLRRGRGILADGGVEDFSAAGEGLDKSPDGEGDGGTSIASSYSASESDEVSADWSSCSTGSFKGTSIGGASGVSLGGSSGGESRVDWLSGG